MYIPPDIGLLLISWFALPSLAAAFAAAISKQKPLGKWKPLFVISAGTCAGWLATAFAFQVGDHFDLFMPALIFAPVLGAIAGYFTVRRFRCTAKPNEVAKNSL
jgi:hypothetical protein